MENDINDSPRWYIVHTYSGQEDKVQKNLYQRIETMDVKDRILEIIVPTEIEVEIKDGERVEVEKKMYAGYLLVNMFMDDESWYIVRNTPGVTGFISAEDSTENRSKPVPLEQHEVDRIINRIDSDKNYYKEQIKVYKETNDFKEVIKNNINQLKK